MRESLNYGSNYAGLLYIIYVLHVICWTVGSYNEEQLETYTKP